MRAILLPLLAGGIVLTGCGSSSSPAQSQAIRIDSCEKAILHELEAELPEIKKAAHSGNPGAIVTKLSRSPNSRNPPECKGLREAQFARVSTKLMKDQRENGDLASLG